MCGGGCVCVLTVISHICFILFIPSSAGEHLGCFHLLALVNNKCTNISSTFSSSGYMPRSRIAGSYGNSVFNFGGKSKISEHLCCTVSELGPFHVTSHLTHKTTLWGGDCCLSFIEREGSRKRNDLLKVIGSNYSQILNLSWLNSKATASQAVGDENKSSPQRSVCLLSRSAVCLTLCNYGL